jgi:glycosyltransferase involved in cell wall biosynthesis
MNVQVPGGCGWAEPPRMRPLAAEGHSEGAMVDALACACAPMADNRDGARLAPGSRTSEMYYHQVLVAPEIGGAARIALEVANSVRDSGRRCLVWVPGDGPARREAQRQDLQTELYNASGLFARSRARAALENWRLARRLRRLSPGVIHVHTPLHYGAMRLALKRSRLRRIVHVHLEEHPEGLRWALRSPPELIITCAQFLVDHVRAALPPRFQASQQIVAVPNAVDVARFQSSDRPMAKARVGAPAKQPLLLMVANLAPHKGQETAIHSVARLRERGIDVACWLAGAERGDSTAYTSRLMSLIADAGVQDRVRLLGHRSDVPQLLAAADYLLLPSTREGLPLSILEAQVAKVLVLAAPSSGIPEIIHDGQTGFLISADDPDGYAHRIELLCGNRALYHRITAAAHQRVVQEHDWHTYVRRIMGCYQYLAS